MSTNPVVLLIVLALAIALFVVPREKLLGPFFLVAVFLPPSQGFDVGGIDMRFARLLIFTIWLRFLLRRELAIKNWNSVDTAMLLWLGIGTIAYILLWGTPDAFINRMGQIVNYAGVYFLVRLSMRNTSDLTHLMKYMRLAAVVLGVLMVEEWLTGRNPFGMIGGQEFAGMREGSIRAQGPFAHSIAAGLFGASLAPIFLGSILARDRRIPNLVALAFSVLIVSLTGSSTPVIALAAGVGAWALWPWRRYTKVFAWGAAAALAVLQLAMQGPVWALIGRANVYSASTGQHRARLVAEFIARMDEWWLVGIQSTRNWGILAGMHDVANNYVLVGVNGGLFTLLAFFFLLWCGFKALGAAIRLSGNNKERALLWSLGASLMVHMVGFFGLAYYDQIVFVFALLLGLISATSSAVLSRQWAALRKGTSKMPLVHAATTQ